MTAQQNKSQYCILCTVFLVLLALGFCANTFPDDSFYEPEDTNGTVAISGPFSSEQKLIFTGSGGSDDGQDPGFHSFFRYDAILPGWFDLHDLADSLYQFLQLWELLNLADQQPEPSDGVDTKKKHSRQKSSQSSTATYDTSRRKKRRGFLRSCCCFSGSSDDDGDGWRREHSGRRLAMSECENSPHIPESEDDGPQIVVAEVQIDVVVPEPEPAAEAAPNPYLIINNVYQSGQLPEQPVPVLADNQDQVIVLMEGGHYVSMVITLPMPMFRCVICSSVLADPVTSCTRHVHCRHCIDNIPDHSCPHCRQACDIVQPHPIVSQQIADIALNCNWCQQPSSVSEIAAHMNHCDRRPVLCALDCGAEIDPQQLGNHLKRCLQERANELPAMPEEQLRALVQQMVQSLNHAMFLATTGADTIICSLGCGCIHTRNICEHLHDCLSSRSLEIGKMEEGQLRALALQMANGFDKPFWPSDGLPHPDWVSLADGLLLEPVSGSPGLFRRANAAEEETEFYIRLSLASIDQRYMGRKNTLVSTSLEHQGKRFYFHIHYTPNEYKCNDMQTQVRYEGSVEDYPGSWCLTYLDANGIRLQEAATDEIINDHQTKENDDGTVSVVDNNGSIGNGVWGANERFLLFSTLFGIWNEVKTDPNYQHIYLRVRFTRYP